MERTGDYERALADWREALGSDAVLDAAGAVERYGPNTLAIERQIPAALLPQNAEEVQQVVRIATKHRVPLYPISTGANWGYGSANPVTDGSVVVDLGRMTGVDDSDIELGLVTVEPGVTQRSLRGFLDERGLPFLVPVHGGGPDCSLLGNALERGYGITPYADHFGAVTALEAVLPNGEIYRSALTELGGRTVDHAFKWGLGPYLDGLFTQGAFGIVTRATIALAPIPERVESFFFSVKREEDFERAVAAVRDALRAAGNVTGSINLMNRRRILSMMAPYPADQAEKGGIVPQAAIDAMARKQQVMPWTGIGAMYGSARVVKAARQVIRKSLRGAVSRLVFLSPPLVAKADGLVSRLPAKGGERVYSYIHTLHKSMQLIAGAPSEIALPLAYWKSGQMPDPDGAQRMNPARDGCGLIWYSPLVPMQPARVRSYVDFVDRVCTEHGIEPLITLTSLSDRCFDSTVPLLFDRGDRDERDRAHACYAALFEQGRQQGFVPYRSGIQTMDKFVRADTTYWRTVAALKQALDPEGIMAPGRYSPVSQV